jgi:ubiquinone biosynthesis monooxygenase Coq6
MAVVDKLHKLYTTDYGPVVWARSTGLEVVNELDSVKAAIMMTAGAEGRKSGAAAGWEAMMKGVEALGGAVQVAGTFSGGIGGIVGARIQGLIGRMAERPRT